MQAVLYVAQKMILIDIVKYILVEVVYNIVISTIEALLCVVFRI